MKKQLLLLFAIFSLVIITGNLSAQQLNTFVTGRSFTYRSPVYGNLTVIKPVTADFDHDGDLDVIATLNEYTRELVLFRNDGTGVLDGGTIIPGTADAVYGIGDVNNDGYMDIVCATLSDPASRGKIFLNDGSGNFNVMDGVFANVSCGGSPLVKIVDINHDFRNDIIYSGIYGCDAHYHTQIWLNTSTTETPDFVLSQDLVTDVPHGTSLAIGDIDNDGDLDMGASSSGNKLVLFINNGGVFSVQTPYDDYFSHTYFIDWDNDGSLDLVYFDGYNNSGLKWRKNDGAGNFDANATVLFDGAQAGFDLSTFSSFDLIDIDRDNLPDAVISDKIQPVKMLLNRVCNFVLKPDIFDSGTSLSNPTAQTFVFGDFNNDGVVDIITCPEGSSVLQVFINAFEIHVTPAPASIYSATGGTACGSGAEVTLNAKVTDGGIVKWWDAYTGGNLKATGPSYTTSLSETTSFYAEAVNADGCSFGRFEVVAILSQPPAAIIAANGATTVCSGNSVVLNATTDHGTTYQWNLNGNAVTDSTNTSYTTTVAGVYTVTVSDGTCSTVSDAITIIVNAVPHVIATATPSLLPGGTIQLTASGAVTYSWTGPGGFSSSDQNPSVTNASPSNTGIYTVTGTDANGCSASANKRVTIQTNTFAQGEAVSYNGTPIASPQLGDFDGDGDLDMLAYLSGSPYSLILFINDGSGHFDGGTAIPGTDDATFGIGDVDNDGDIDIVCAQIFSNHTYGKILLNDGHGSFTMMDGSFMSGFADGYPLVTVADIDKDGKNEIIYSGIRTNDGFYQTEIWNNTGTTANPDFALSQTTTAVDVPYGASLAIGDIDEDGDLDMGSASNSNGLVLFTNNNGIFTVTTPISDYCSQSYFIDWDHDGHLDYVYFDGYNNSGLKWRKGDGHGNFAETAITLFDFNTSGLDLSHWSAFSLKDVDNDGYLDAIVSINNGDLNGTKIFLNKGGCGGFILQQYDLASGASSTQGTAVGDLDGDGFADAVTTFSGTDAQVYFNQLYHGAVLELPVVTGAGTFTACGSTTSVTLTATASGNSMLQWWDSPTGGTLLATGDYAVQVSGTTVFYLDAMNSNGCTSAERLPVTVSYVEITPVPATIHAVGATEFCPSGSVTLIASGGGSNFLWSNGETTSSIVVSTSGGYSATITDQYGCSTKTDVVVVTVADRQPPVFTNCPGNITVNATSAQGATVNYTKPPATDNCSVTVALTSGLTSGSTFPIGTTTVTYTATDGVGQTATCSFTVKVSGLAPSIQCPGNIVVNAAAGQCGANVSFAASATSGAVTYSAQPGSFFAIGTHTITATVTNAVGSASCSFTIMVKDVEAPVLTGVPSNSTVACNAVPAPATVTATDCGSNVAVIYNEVRSTGSCPGNYILTRTWSATDAAGNTSNRTQVITVQDTQAPVLSDAPANVTVECNAVPGAAILTATDNCSTPVVTYNEVRTDGNCSGRYTLTRTWTATDACSNTSSKTQVITVQDTQVPVLSDAPANVTVECNAIPAAAILTATDNCSTPTVTYNEVRTDGTCSSRYTLARTWTATDACSNTSSKTQVITVQDTQAPVLSDAPANVTVECNAIPEAATLTATDNCSTPVVTYNEVRTDGNCLGRYTLTRTWTGTDACSNTSSKTQVITVQDTQAPVLSDAPANVTVECNAVPTAATLAATDNCSTPIVTYNEVRTDGNCPGRYTLTRTWTATDACNNTSSKTQVITVQDTQAPVLSDAPANVTVECNAVPSAAILTATDNCSTPTVTYNEVTTNGTCSGRYTLTRTWTATDACGNTSSKTQVITVQDTQAPVLSAAPASVTVECDAVPSAAILTATGNCSTPVVTYNEVRTDGNCPGRYTLTRTWTATDACSNTSSKTQVITVQDTQAPVLSDAPANVTVECNAVPSAAILTATDNCSTPVVTYNEVRTDGNCSGRYTLTRTWTATDACGNASSKTQVITVQDTQAPVLSDAPANVTVECNAVPSAAILTATDNCSTPVVTYNEVRNNETSSYNYTLTRTWTATDSCGNNSSKIQVITVRDTKAPIATVAALPTLNGDCAVIAIAPTALDNCAGIITATTVNPTSYTVQGVYTITWSYNDGNGNTSSQTQRVEVKGATAPVPTVNVLPTVTGQCSATVTAKPKAIDACSGITFEGTTTDPLTYTVQGRYIVHWTYTGNSGNKSYQNQTVIVQDNTAPVPNTVSLPVIKGQCSVNISMVSSTHCMDNCYCCRYVCHCRTSECNCRQWSNWIANILWYFFGGSNDDNHGCDHDDDVDDVNNMKMQAPTATDNCKGTIIGTTTDPLTYSTQGTYIIHWKFDDGNGNVSIQNQTVKIADVEAPVPNANNLSTVYGTCSATVTTKPTARDNCKGVITGTTTDPLTYTTQGTFTIHWTYSDGNGNTTTQNQTVIIKDDTKPKLTEPGDITISCGTSTLPAATGNATATDNCGTPVITYADVVNGNKITRTWRATDAAGNYDTDTQVITIADNTKPVITAPASITVNCGAATLPATTGFATATDNCSTPTVTYTDVTSGNRITRTWKATDAAGNYSTSMQTITIGLPFTATVSSVPTSNTYTGGNDNNLYIGYGAQSTTLQMCSLPSAGAPYTYIWNGSYTNKLNSTTSSAPVFTPTGFGYYTFSVTVTNKYGCTSTATIGICVTDVRIAGSNGKVYICHSPPGNPVNRQTLSVNVNAVDAHLAGHTGDRLGSCDVVPCATQAVASTTPLINALIKTPQTEEATRREELKVTVMPNPTITFFTLKLESKYETPVNIRVMDESGRVIDARSKIGANSTIQIGHNYSSGTYYAEIIQGNTKKVVQMVKARG